MAVLIVTARVPRRKLALSVAAAALLCCCTLALNLGQAVSQEVSGSALPDPKGVRSNQDRIDYLSAYGWQVKEEPLATQELQRVPGPPGGAGLRPGKVRREAGQALHL